MKCPNCGSEKITVVNQPIQLKEKTDSVIIDIFAALSVLALLIGVIGFFTIVSVNNGDLEKVPFYLISLALMKWSVISLVAIGILNALRPHKWENQLVGICMDCGHAKTLKAFKETLEENPATVPSEENE